MNRKGVRKPVSATKPMNLVGKSHPILLGKADAILESEIPDYFTLASRMLATCRVKGGVAIAAPQVGVPVQLVVQWNGNVLINPEVELDEGSGTEPGLEGCLSIPGRTFKVERFLACSISAWNMKGERQEYDAEGLDARMIQHELDHLGGVLISERGTEVKGSVSGLRM